MRVCLFFFIFSAAAFGQIQMHTSAKPLVEHYDSTTNRIKDISQIIGQKFFVMGSESSRKYGYHGFSKGIDRNDPNWAALTQLPYEDVANKYFEVIDTTSVSDYWILKLRDSTTLNMVYYCLNQSFLDYDFPFLITGFYLKQRSQLIGHRFKFNLLLDYDKKYDIKTGKPIEQPLANWTCEDIIITDGDYQLCLVLKNWIGERIVMPFYSVFESDGTLSKYVVKID